MGVISVERVVDKLIDVAPYIVGGYLVYLIIRPKTSDSKGSLQSATSRGK